MLAVLRTEASRARVASARSAEESAAAELAHSGLVPVYHLAVLPACDSALAADLAGLLACGSAQAGLAVLMAHDSAPADYLMLADQNEQRCSRNEPPVHWPPVAELRHD